MKEHLADDCEDFWHCKKLHRIMTRTAELDLMNYPGEWVLFDRREGVKYHSKDAKDLHPYINSGLIMHFVPEPRTTYIL